MATRSLNKVLLIGNLTRDPELRYTSSGTPVTTFGIATNRVYNDSSGKTVETAEFTNIVAWAKLGEICAQLLKKGTKVYIEGRLQTTKWDDKETGKRMQRTEVVANEMMILSGGASNNANTSDEGNTNGAGSAPASDMGENVDFNDLGDAVDDTDSNSTPF